MTEAWKKWEGQLVNGKFRLRQFLGGSESAAVFLTERGEREPQKAAIKLIPADSGSPELQLSRWTLAAKLSHPHLIRLFEMGRCQLGQRELLYLVMEYAEEDLSQILPQRPLTPAEARDMLEPALTALAYLHGQGFVHGHIKPANIMARDDQLELSSDGLCPVGKSSGGSAKPTLYDPPETAAGAISPAGDVWSLGMTLVEALTQRLPVWQGTPQGEPVPPETLPAPFLDIARHCLLRDPQRRWTVADIAARLQPPSPVPRQSVTKDYVPQHDVKKPQTTARPLATFAKLRFIVPALAVGLALVVILADPRLLKPRPPAHGAASQRARSVASEQPPARPKPEPKPVTPETAQSTQHSILKTSDKEQGSTGPARPVTDGSAPSPASPSSAAQRSEAASKTPTGRPVPGEVVQQVLPDVSQKARDTIQGKVRVSVRVRVDPSGNVVGAEFDSPGPSLYFADLALQAARRWKFAPAKVDGRNVPSEWLLRFEFAPTTTQAFPVHAAP